MASTRIHNSINSRQYRGAFLLVLVLALFLGNSWAGCSSWSGGYPCSQKTTDCPNSATGTCNFLYAQGSNEYLAGCSSVSVYCTTTPSVYCSNPLVCTDKCSADSVKCINKGYLWNSANCFCDDPQICAPDKAACENFGGRWSGTTRSDGEGGTCCSSICNTCVSERFKELAQKKKNICCQQGFAPPPDTAMCAPLLVHQSCGMATPDINTNEGAWSCYAPNDAETISRYNQMCLESSSSSDDGGSSSSGDGGGGSSSSGDGGGSSSSGTSPYPEGCEECPWLDSILDTLTRQKWIVQDIYDCLLMPYICGLDDNQKERDTIDFALDTGLIHIVFKPYMDSSLKLDSGQVRELIKIDSSLKYVIRIDSALLASDSVTRKAIIGGLLENDSTVDALNDSTRKWLRHISDSLRVYNDSNRLYLGYIADSISISVDSLITHIDSIKRNIPKDVFDSILKYQKQLAESDDSVIVHGLPALDSLIDSSLKYWKMGLGYDSIYNSVFKDSIKSIHDAISDIGGSVGYGLGYGDTASKTMRNDLEGIKGAVDSLHGGIGDIVGLLTAGAADSSSVGYASGFVSEGENYADSLARAIGWKGGLDGVNVDSVYSHSTWETSGVDSVNEFVSDTLGGILDSLHVQLKSENDSIISYLPDSLTVWADSLIKVSPFVTFDSLIYSTLGAKIPNSDQCPEGCQSWSLTLPRFGLVNYTVDFGLCLGRVPLGGLNVLSFLRLIIRLVIVWSCISIVMWNFSQRKM